MMKNLFLVAFLFIGFVSYGQNKVPNDSLIIHQLVQSEFDAVWSALDTNGLSNFHTEDFLLLEHGEVWTNDTIKSYQIRAIARPNRMERINSFKFIDVRSESGIIWASYHNYASFRKEGEEMSKRQWLESVVAIETKKGWRLQQMHSTRVNMKK